MSSESALTDAEVVSVVTTLRQHANTPLLSMTAYDTRQIGINQGFLSKVVLVSNVRYNIDTHLLPTSFVVKVPQFDRLRQLLEHIDAGDSRDAAGKIALLEKVSSSFFGKFTGNSGGKNPDFEISQN